ncbi:MAG: HEAT repeat domain-containing protein [Candidatus Eremiobacteraeota bacterium]|nr:HEAT repeat domain-containing protein [Candidatus Eremiobacteraeota bacterium]
MSRRAAEAIAAFEKIEKRGGSPTEGYILVCSVPIKSSSTADAFVKGLSSSHWRVVLGCLKNVGRWAAFPDKFIPELIRLLQHRETSVQSEAAKALGAFGSEAELAVPKLVQLCPKAELLVAEQVVLSLCAIPGGESHARTILLEYLDASRRGEEWCSDYVVKPAEYEPYGRSGLNVPKIGKVCSLLSGIEVEKEDTLERVGDHFRANSWGSEENPNILRNVQTELLSVFRRLGCSGVQDDIVEFVRTYPEEARGRMARQLLYFNPDDWTEEQRERLVHSSSL